MANPDNSSNTTIVAILVIVALILGLLYFTGIGGPKEGSPTDGQTNVNVERPAGIDRSSIIERSTERSSVERPSQATDRSSTTHTQERTNRS